MAENRAKLHKYERIESTEVSIKGEKKRDEQNGCLRQATLTSKSKQIKIRKTNSQYTRSGG